MMSANTEQVTIEEKPAEEKPCSKTLQQNLQQNLQAKPAAKPVAKPAAKPVELPAFEKNISDKIVEKFGDKIVVSFVKENRVGINVDKENVHDVARFIRDELNYDHVESVSGVDYPQDKEIEVVYHIGSYSDPSLASQLIVLATRAEREENPIPGKDATKLPTLRDIFLQCRIS